MSPRDPTHPIEALERENAALRQRVAELEQRLARFPAGEPAALGDTMSEREALLLEAERIAHMGSWVWDVSSDEVFWSDELYRILGYDPSTDKASVEAYFARIHPDDRGYARQKSDEALATGVSPQIDVRVLRPDGGVRYVSVNGALLVDEEGHLQRAVGSVLDITDAHLSALQLIRTAARLERAQRMASMGSFEWDLASDAITCGDPLLELLGRGPAEASEILRAGVLPQLGRSPAVGTLPPFTVQLELDRPRTFQVHALPIESGGARTGLEATLTDITERIQLEDQLRHAQKMEAIGQLAGGVAHDFNNLLTIILGNLELSPQTSIDRRLGEARRAAQAAGDLTAKLLAFGRKAMVVPQTTDVNRVVREVMPLLRSAATTRVELHAELAPDLWIAEADPSQLQTMLLNLVINARDAIRESGRVTITTRNTHLGRERAGALALAAGDYLELSVRDDGTGMDATTAARAFEPFFTTKEIGRGTGLGLSMVYGAARQAGGTAALSSSPGHGTTVTLWLPRAALHAPLPVTVPPPARPCRRILLVDDDAAVLKVMKTILVNAGHQVTAAGNAEEALRLARGSPTRYDLLVTDLAMPGMTGAELAVRLREHDPELGVLYVTGFVDIGDLELKEGFSHLLTKPMDGATLCAAVDNLGTQPAKGR